MKELEIDNDIDSPLRIAYQCCPPSDCRRLWFSVTADFVRLTNYYIIIIIIIIIVVVVVLTLQKRRLMYFGHVTRRE